MHARTHKHTNACLCTCKHRCAQKTSVCLCLCVCVRPPSLSLWAGTGPKRVLTRLMGFHTLKYTHVHTFGYTIMLKINMSESYVWSQTNKHTHPHMHTLWYKRICQAPTLYTCKTNGLQKSTQPSLLLSHFQNTQLHTPAWTNMSKHAAASPTHISRFMSAQNQCCITPQWSVWPLTVQVEIRESTATNLLEKKMLTAWRT